MPGDFLIGVALVIVAGAMEGLFSLPVTRTPRWRFEHIWGAGSLLALLLVPWPLAWWMVPDLARVYEQAGTNMVLLALAFGIGWGLGGIFWGQAIAAVGMALGISLLMGLINVFGAIGPMALLEPAKLATGGGLALIGAVAVMVLGVVIVALAGKRKEQDLAGAAGEIGPATTKPATPFSIGLLFCVLSGLLSASVNFGLILGGPIAETAVRAGAPKWAGGFAIWALVFTGNYAVNTIYAFILMARNQTFGLFFRESRPSYWLGALFMGLAWPGGIAIYGVAAGKLGDWGPYVGFPMMLVCSILFGNLAGWWTGEWRGTSVQARRWMQVGVSTLLASLAVLGWSNFLLAAQN